MENNPLQINKEDFDKKTWDILLKGFDLPSNTKNMIIQCHGFETDHKTIKRN